MRLWHWPRPPLGSAPLPSPASRRLLARSYALTPLEQERLGPEVKPGETRQPVLGYLRHTEDGWKLDMLPGAVTRTGPLPVLTSRGGCRAGACAVARGLSYAPLLRIDF